MDPHGFTARILFLSHLQAIVHGSIEEGAELLPVLAVFDGG